MTDYYGICRLPDDCLASHESLAMMIKVNSRFIELAPSFHTRAMKENFSKFVGSVVSLKPFEERFLYKVITNDCSVNQNEENDLWPQPSRILI